MNREVPSSSGMTISNDPNQIGSQHANPMATKSPQNPHNAASDITLPPEGDYTDFPFDSGVNQAFNEMASNNPHWLNQGSVSSSRPGSTCII